ncbi:MAG: apolipoprotein N-acyltransferase [Rhodoferax sp.]
MGPRGDAVPERRERRVQALNQALAAKFRQSPVRRATVAALLTGGLLGAAYLCIPHIGPILAWGALLPLLRLWQRERHPGFLAAASTLGMGLAQGVALGYFLPFDPAAVSLVLLVQACTASLPWLALAALCHLTRRRPAGMLWLLPGLWLINEWIFSFVPDIVPTPLGGTLGGHPSSIWFYSLSGAWGGSLLLVFVQVWLVKARRPFGHRLAVVLLLIASLHVMGAVLQWFAPLPQPQAKVALLRTGPHLPTDDILPWLDRAMDLSAHAVRAGADLVVWPEAMIPWDIASDESHPLQRALRSLPQRHGVAFIIGINQAPDPFSLYNSAVLLRPGESIAQAQIQHKRWLLPQRESAYFFGLGKGWVRSGDQSRALRFDDRTGARHAIGPLICYEVLVSAAGVAQVRAGAQALLVLANDAEFDHTPARWQLDAQARVRAIETGRDVLRVASVGALQHINAWGHKVLEQQGDADFVLAAPGWHQGLDLYVRHPHWLPVLMLCVMPLLMGVTCCSSRPIVWNSPSPID